MADLAKLVVRLELQSAQLLSELDKTNRKLGGFEKGIKGFSSRIKTAFGIFAGGFGLSKIIEASAEAAKNFAQLENAVANAGDAAGGRTAKQFADVSEQLQNITTYSDDTIQGVQQLLLRFQSIRTDRFDEATKSVLDLSTAMGTDAESAAKLLGKALSDPEKGMAALAKAGVIFSDQQKKVIKDLADTGRLAEAQGLILDELGKKFGGAAEAARNNFGGALEGIKNDIGNLLEVNGGLPEATKSLNELSKVLQDPAVKAGADALFSLLITGAGKAAELIGKTAAGLAVMFNATGDRVEELGKQIDFLEKERDSFLPFVTNLGAKSDIFPKGGFLNEVLTPKEIDAKIAELKGMQNAILGLGVEGIETAKKTTTAFTEIAAAYQLPDITVIDGLTEAQEKAQKALESAGKSLTDSLLTPLEKYDVEVAHADELLKANVITQETWMRALGAARGELNDTTQAVMDAAAGYESLDQAIEKAHKASMAGIEKDLASEAGDLGPTGGPNVDKQIEEEEKKLSEFAKRATENTQDILSDGIYEGLTDGFDRAGQSILDSFKEMILKMVAQAAAAQLGQLLFGTEGVGSGGGIVGTGLKWLSTIFGGSMDSGGRGRPGVEYMIGTGAQPERFVPDTAGTFYPAGDEGLNVTNHFTIQAPDGSVSRQTQLQIAAMAARSVSAANARNNR